MTNYETAQLREHAGGRLPLKKFCPFFIRNDRKEYEAKHLWKRFLLSEKRTKTREDDDKKSYFRSFWFLLQCSFFPASHKCWRSLTMVTNDSVEDQSDQNEYKLPWKYFLLNFLFVINGREHYYFMSHSNIPGGAIKYPRDGTEKNEYLKQSYLFRLRFSLEPCMKRENVGKSVIFFREFETNGYCNDCSNCMEASHIRQRNLYECSSNEIFTVNAIEHCSFFLLVSRSKGKATDMQHNHAGSSFKINYVWLKRPAKD